MSLGAYNSRRTPAKPASRHFEGIDPSAWARKPEPAPEQHDEEHPEESTGQETETPGT